MKDKLTATFFVMLHLLIVLAHGKSHSQLHIHPTTWQGIFIALVIVIGPILAMSLLWMGLRIVGLVLLSATMTGSLLFGVVYHFLIPGSDNALELHAGHWESLFRMTAIWLAVTETVPVAWSVWALKQISRVGRGGAIKSACS